MGTLPETLPEMDLQQIFENPLIQELAEKQWKDLETQVKLPYAIKGHILMSPGVWNDFFYGGPIIDAAYKNTEWSKVTRSLFWDHKDDQASEWVGEVDNLRCENGNLIGDVIVVDKALAMKLAFGAKFGVSPKIIGESDYYRRVQDAHFENFSIVINPAVKTTFLNSQIKIKNGGRIMANVETLAQSEELQEEETEEEEEVTEEQLAEKKKKDEELKKKKYEKPEEQKQKKKPYEYSEIDFHKLAEAIVEELKKEKYEYPEEAKEKKKPEEELKKKRNEYPEEKSEIPGLTEELSAYTDFVKSFLKKNPGKSIADAAKAWAKEHTEQSERHRLKDYVEEIQIGPEVITSKPGEFTQEMREMIKPTGGSEFSYEALPTNADTKMAEWLKGGLN